jgi:hypothetical protein
VVTEQVAKFATWETETNSRFTAGTAAKTGQSERSDRKSTGQFGHLKEDSFTVDTAAKRWAAPAQSLRPRSTAGTGKFAGPKSVDTPMPRRRFVGWTVEDVRHGALMSAPRRVSGGCWTGEKPPAVTLRGRVTSSAGAFSRTPPDRTLHAAGDSGQGGRAGAPGMKKAPGYHTKGASFHPGIYWVADCDPRRDAARSAEMGSRDCRQRQEHGRCPRPG